MVKSQTDTFWATITGGFFASVAYLMGGVDNLLVCLSVLMLSDYVTGLAIGYFDKAVSSQRAYKGIAKKMSMFIFVIVANQVDIIFTGQDGQLRNYILMLLIATEGISLTENFGKLGLPVPAFWLNALEAIKTKSQEGGTMTDLINKKIEEKMKEDKKND